LEVQFIHGQAAHCTADVKAKGKKEADFGF
jgi:hypothetical protein